MRFFAEGRPDPRWLARLDAIRDVLTCDGRTLAQGALSPGQAAEQSGFSLDTLRYYEKIGLITVGRRANGHRAYGNDDLEWLGVLRCLRDTGMPIADMRRYAELARAGDATMQERLRLLAEHDNHVAATIKSLQDQREHLREKIAWYQEQLGADSRNGSR